MASVEELIAKIKRPPSLPNWVRLNDRRRDETAKRIAGFLVSRPKHALAQIYSIMADYVTFRIGEATALKAVSRIKNLMVRNAGHEIVPLLIDWFDEREVKGIRVYHDFAIMYPIGRGMFVPVKPTFVFNDQGKLTPVFVIGWASIALNDFQKHLLSSIIERAILSLEEFVGSDALIVTVPRIRGTKSERWVRSWKVSDYPSLGDDKLVAQFERFGGAIDDVVPILEEMAKREGR